MGSRVRGERVVVSGSEEATRALGVALAREVRAGDIVALHGELGAGKTRFVAGIAEGLGIDRSVVNSPTYVLVNEYPAGGDAVARGIEALVHIDAYRLEVPTDLESLGLDERLVASSVTVIEWPERLGGAMPDPTHRVSIAITGEGERRVSIDRG